MTGFATYTHMEHMSNPREVTHIRPTETIPKDAAGRLVKFSAICGVEQFGGSNIGPEFAPMFTGNTCPACAAGGVLGQLDLFGEVAR